MKLAINNNIVDVEEPADKTVLQFLREQGLTGTKEGCASGDCGACTVMVRRRGRDGDTIAETINACIAPIGQFTGCHLMTVEGLATDDQLHPAQQAMVECHGSQCGFCTPGFVMSLATLVETGSDDAAGRESVLEGISGNLCRCTGYKPIVDAGLKALESDGVIDDAALLNELADVSPGKGDSVLQPNNEAALQRAITDYPDAKLIAGGTDLFLEVTQRYVAMPMMIDVSGVEELNVLAHGDDALVIGASVPYTRLEHELGERSQPLRRLLMRLGSRQIRNRGTVGGNLANGSPIADMPPILIAWDAELELVNAAGASRRSPIAEFYRGYRDTTLAADEYIARVHIPRAAMNDFHRFYKSSKRLEDDISSVMGAFRFAGTNSSIDSARIAFGGMAATPVRLHAVEQLLEGNDLSDALIEDAAASLHDTMSPLTDVRASARYRMAMAQSMLTRALKAYQGDVLPLVTEVELNA